MSLQRHLVLGTVAQQAGQAVGLVSSLVLSTALARSLDLPEFGVYGLVVSFATYLFFALGSAEAAAVRSVAAAGEDEDARSEAVTAAAVVYVGFGVVSGVLLAAGGTLLLPLFDLSEPLATQAERGVLALALTTALGFPMRLFQDVLRARQHFRSAGVAEAVGYTLLAGAVLVCLFVIDTPLWVLIGVGGALPLWLGLAAAGVSLATGVRLRIRPRSLRGANVRAFTRVAGGMAFVGASDVVISSLDRSVLAAFRSAATVGLYEGAFRLNSLVRAFVGSLSTTLLPVLSAFSAAGETGHSRALLLRGTRYMLAVVVPPTTVAMVLSDDLLGVWLGEEFRAAGGAAAIFLAWWLLAPAGSIASSMLVADGRVGRLAAYSWAIAALNAALSLSLTPWLGLEGVVIGTSGAYAAVLPFFLRYALRRSDIAVSEFARTALLPAYGGGICIAGAVALAKVGINTDTAGPVLALAALGTAAGYALILFGFFDRNERAMLVRIVRPAG